ncbi:MAG: RsmE family RNA methyltransferase [Verrucomicrobiota bacterium]|jgi:16S rRNA (uracil1498-N3)-methyltransferase
MHRFYLPPEQCQQEALFLTGREAHHALEVLRVRRGERVKVLNGAGLELRCEVQESEPDKVKLAVVERRAVAAPPCQITLLQALPKGKIIESIIQKATELGAFRIVPLLSERVVTRLGEREAVRKAGKWRWVAIEAIKQCGSAWLPKVEAALTPQAFLARREQFDLPLLACLGPESRPLREYLGAFGARHGRPPQTACVWVGPEGDFTPAETDAIKAAGGLPLTLGPLVLRTATAATYCLSILHYELAAPLNQDPKRPP